MGGGDWNTNLYRSQTTQRRSTGQRDFGYDHKVKIGAATGLHPSLDPAGVAGPGSALAGKPVRESRDSDDHPLSMPIAVIFDVTGSMGRIPQVLQTKLALLMDVILTKTGIKDPQILVGAVGDANTDKYPFQVGQFESDNRFDEQLRNIILEGNGGGQVKESYGLAYRFAANHTATDSFEKRGKRGYFFTIGDEAPWPTIPAQQVRGLFGIDAEDERIEDVIARAQEAWNIYHIHALDGSYAYEKSIPERWMQLLGERLIQVEDSSLICEVIAGIIHMNELSVGADAAIREIGLSGDASRKVANALVPIGAGTRVAKSGSAVSGRLPAGHSHGGMARI